VLRVIKIIPNVPTYARAVVLGNPLIDQIRTRGGIDQNGLLRSLPKHYLASSEPIRRVSLSKQSCSRQSVDSCPLLAWHLEANADLRAAENGEGTVEPQPSRSPCHLLNIPLSRRNSSSTSPCNARERARPIRQVGDIGTLDMLRQR
jgi:hypothetical protein